MSSKLPHARCSSNVVKSFNASGMIAVPRLRLRNQVPPLHPEIATPADFAVKGNRWRYLDREIHRRLPKGCVAENCISASVGPDLMIPLGVHVATSWRNWFLDTFHVSLDDTNPCHLPMVNNSASPAKRRRRSEWYPPDFLVSFFIRPRNAK